MFSLSLIAIYACRFISWLDASGRVMDLVVDLSGPVPSPHQHDKIMRIYSGGAKINI